MSKEPHDAQRLSQAMTRLSVSTPGRGFFEITAQANGWLDEVEALDGVVTAFIQHTSASLVVQENADPDVQVDLLNSLETLAPQNAGYAHTCEGPDDMPAHIKSMLTSTSLSIPVIDGRMALGTWQGLYVAEHRTKPHHRNVVLHYLGEMRVQS